MTERRVDVDDLAFRLRESPAPDGSSLPTVVLVHGIGMSHRYLTRLHAVLAVSTGVVSVDLPGFAGLPKPVHDADVPRMGRALAEVLGSLDGGPLVLVGHSMGMQWVTEAARSGVPDLRVVVGIGPVVDERHRTLPRQAVALARDTLGESPRINAIVFSDYLRCGVPWYLTQVRHMLAYSTEHAVRDLRVPLLLIRGGSDPVAGREWCRRLRDAAPVSRLVEVPGHHHVVQESGPRAVADAILTHARSTGLDRVGAWS